jgi:hypothetical protein
MAFIVFAKGVEQFDFMGNSLGIGSDRSLYYNKSIGRRRLYRSAYPLEKVLGTSHFVLYTFPTREEAQVQANHVNEVYNDNFVVQELEAAESAIDTLVRYTGGDVKYLHSKNRIIMAMEDYADAKYAAKIKLLLGELTNARNNATCSEGVRASISLAISKFSK